MKTWLDSLDKNELRYWMGLIFVFIGLSLRVSVATALTVVGIVIAVESVITSYLATWLSWKGMRK